MKLKHQNKIDEYINKGITLRKGKLVLDSKHDYYKIFNDILKHVLRKFRL